MGRLTRGFPPASRGSGGCPDVGDRRRHPTPTSAPLLQTHVKFTWELRRRRINRERGCMFEISSDRDKQSACRWSSPETSYSTLFTPGLLKKKTTPHTARLISAALILHHAALCWSLKRHENSRGRCDSPSRLGERCLQAINENPNANK